MKQSGFTLIELMITVAIVGLLAAIAGPAYQDYIRRARVAEGLMLASQAKTGIWEYFSMNGVWPANNQQVALPAPASIHSEAVRSITVNGSQVQIEFTTVVESGRFILMAAKNTGGALAWLCSGGDLPNNYRPSSCR